MLADGADSLNPAIMDLPGNIYYHGYWINRKWLKMLEEEGEFLNFPEITDDENREILKTIDETDSTSIHIRRGDYVDLGWSADVSAIRKMIEMLIEKIPGTSLFVFSDDIEWVKKNCSFEKDIIDLLGVNFISIEDAKKRITDITDKVSIILEQNEIENNLNEENKNTNNKNKNDEEKVLDDNGEEYTF